MEVNFQNNSDKVLSETKKRIKKALEICGGKAESYAKNNLTENKSVDTGRLRNSITHKQTGENEETIGSTVEYAPYVELGHSQESGRYVPAIGARLVQSFVPGKPFLRPAAEDHGNEYKSIMERVLKGEEN